MQKKGYKNSTPSTFRNTLSRFFRIDASTNIFERQRSFIFMVFVSFAFLNAIRFVIQIMTSEVDPFIVAANIAHTLLVGLLLTLYSSRVISIYVSIFVLILIVQVEISGTMFGLIGTPDALTGIQTNLTMEGVLILLSIASYIRYLSYFLTAIIILTLCSCAYLTGSDSLWRVAPVLSGVFLSLAVMGDYLVKNVISLQLSKDNLNQEQGKVFEFLNMTREEMLKLIKYSGYKKLSDKQKGRLIELLDDRTKKLVLDTAADVVRKKKQDLTALDTLQLQLTTTQKEVCLKIIEGMSVNEIALKLNKSVSAITNIRSKIRQKLNLSKEEDLGEALSRLVERETPDTPAE